MKNQWLTIKQLDRQLRDWQAIKNKYGKPKAGWIKTLRMALGMSAEQLADRLGLTRGRIAQLEAAEPHEAVTLKTLNEAANALGCELVYAIVPKHNGSLQDIIEARVEQISKNQVARVAHSMSLEAQTVGIDTLKSQQEELKKELRNQVNKKLWVTSNNLNKLAKAISMQLLKNKEIIPTKKDLKNDPEFTSYLQKALMENKLKNNPDNKLNDPEYIKALQNAIARYSRNIKKRD